MCLFYLINSVTLTTSGFKEFSTIFNVSLGNSGHSQMRQGRLLFAFYSNIDQ